MYSQSSRTRPECIFQ